MLRSKGRTRHKNAFLKHQGHQQQQEPQGSLGAQHVNPCTGGYKKTDTEQQVISGEIAKYTQAQQILNCAVWRN